MKLNDTSGKSLVLLVSFAGFNVQLVAPDSFEKEILCKEGSNILLGVQAMQQGICCIGCTSINRVRTCFENFFI